MRVLNEVVDMPLAVQHQVPVVQKVHMTHEAPQLQFTDEMVHILVVAQRQMPLVEKIRKTTETVETEVPVVTQRKVPEVPHVQSLNKMAEIPVVMQR